MGEDDGRLSIADRVEELGIYVADAEFTHADDDGFRYWRVTLACGDREPMTVPYGLGPAHGNRSPIADEVVSDLASDVAAYENADGFEDWCSEWERNPDSIKMLNTYNEIGAQRDELKHLVGSDAAYEALLRNTEFD